MLYIKPLQHTIKACISHSQIVDYGFTAQNS